MHTVLRPPKPTLPSLSVPVIRLAAFKVTYTDLKGAESCAMIPCPGLILLLPAVPPPCVPCAGEAQNLVLSPLPACRGSWQEILWAEAAAWAYRTSTERGVLTPNHPYPCLPYSFEGTAARSRGEAFKMATAPRKN